MLLGDTRLLACGAIAITFGFLLGCSAPQEPTTQLPTPERPTTLRPAGLVMVSTDRELGLRSENTFWHISFVRRSAVVQTGDTVVEFLARLGIVPNADAVEALSALNPGSDLSALQAGTLLDVPWPNSFPQLKLPFELFVDKRSKDQLMWETRANKSLCSKFHDRTLVEVPGLQVADFKLLHVAVTDLCSMLHATAERIANRTLVTTQAFLAVLTVEAKLFREIVNRILETASTLDIRSLELLTEDLREQTALFIAYFDERPVPTPRVTVDVRTNQQRHDGVHEVRGYRVWYTPMLDYKQRSDGFPLGKLTPSRAELPPGTYALWATSGGATRRLGLLKGVRVVPERSLEVKRIDLVINARAE